MKTMIRVTLVCALSALLPVWAEAPLELVSPRNGETVCTLRPEHRDFLAKSREERRALLVDPVWRKRMVDEAGSFPLPVTLEWKGGEGPFAVKVSLAGRTVLETNLAARTVNVWNLEIARRYDWTVCSAGSCARGEFRTLDLAPRVMYVPNVGNVRDLGGRIGIGGRRVRQGLVYRSAGLNTNAIPKEPRKKGVLSLTPEGLRIATVDLGWKTDIDLRGDAECWGMEGSPAGAGVKWLHYSSSHYGGLRRKAGQDAFIKVFKAFLDERNYPIDFHCKGGADRTGTVAYILNALLGVDDEELVKDWEFTCFHYPKTKFSHKGYYDELLAVFAKLPGSNTREKVESYVKGLGFTDADLEKFRRIMLENP